MFGYRLVRAAEYAELKDELATTRRDIVTLLKNLSAVAVKAASKETMADMLTLRINQVEHELGTLKHSVTGLPVMTTSIAKGSPTQNAALAAGADLFEDVGDEAAQRLRDGGLLHDEVDFSELVAPARNLVGSIGE